MDRCQRCFREFEGPVCSHCGYPEKGHNASHQLPVGTVLRGRYQIGKSLGQGGFGITYLAWDKLMLQTVAVKEFYPNGTVFRRNEVSTAVECGTKAMIPHYEYSRERFLREAGALVKFRDIPEIVDILDFAEENNTSYIVMEFVRGVDLAKYIRMKGGRLSPEETFRILKPVMEALAKVHKGGIVHRDISPDNIILDPMGGAKLLDFGAVRAVENPDVDTALNKSTEAILKQGFAPLEQYNSRGSLGPWTDEYAMCATVWYCLTGKVPEDASIRMMEGIDPDWSSIEGLPTHQQKALAKGFSCRAKDRYKDLDELLADLFPEGVPITVPGAVVQTAPIPETAVEAAPVPTRPAAAKEKTKAPKKRGKKGWILAIPAVLAVLIAAAVFLPKGAKTQPEETLPEDTAPVQMQTDPTETEATESLSEEEKAAYLHAESLLPEGKLGEAAIAFGKLSGVSDARERSFAIWENIAERDIVDSSYCHTVGLKSDGTVVAVGKNDHGQCDVSGWTDIVAISVFENNNHAGYTIALRADGTVVAVGNNEYGQCEVSAWSDIVAISTMDDHTVGLRADGTVVATGRNDYGQCEVSGWTDIVAISTGWEHTVGLRADGTVVAAGSNSFGECDVSAWNDIVAISAEYGLTLGLRADGTVVAVGSDNQGQCDVSGWTDIVAISAGGYHTVGLRADGTVVAVGLNAFGQCDVSGWTDIVAVSAGGSHTVGLRADGTVVAAGRNEDSQYDVSGWTDIVTIGTGYWCAVGLRGDGTVVAAGSNEYGQCDVSGWTNIRQPQERVPFR